MTSGSRPTRIIAPRRVQRRRPRREGGGAAGISDIASDYSCRKMPTGLYVHLPFCRVHCAYCPFAVSTNIALQDDYTAALVREIAARASGEAVDTIFFGGGWRHRTSRENLTRVVDSLRSSFAIDPDAEFSLEANPEDITPDAIDFWRSLGVNRLSIGVQSFHDA